MTSESISEAFYANMIDMKKANLTERPLTGTALEHSTPGVENKRETPFGKLPLTPRSEPSCSLEELLDRKRCLDLDTLVKADKADTCTLRELTNRARSRSNWRKPRLFRTSRSLHDLSAADTYCTNFDHIFP